MKATTAEITRTGAFADPAQEQSFSQGSIGRAREEAYLVIVATTMTSLGFAPLDLLTLTGDRLSFYLTDRLIIALICTAAVVLIARAGEYRRIVRLTYVQQVAFFTLNALIFNHPVLLRHGGALMPLIAIALFIFLPGSFRGAALLSAYAPMVSLLFWGVLRPQPEASQDLTIIFLLTLVAYVVGGLARTQFARMRREEHLHNQTLREAKEEAEAGAKAKADFLAVMSHEIRTPMSGVLGMLRLVLDGPLSARERGRLQTACQSAEGLLVILDDILDFSKLEAGPLEMETTPFDLPTALDGVVALMELRAAEKGLTLTLAKAPDLPEWIAGDVGRLRQVLFNLVGNAVKFTQEGGVVIRAEPRTRTDGTITIEFSVTDTGPGIDAQQRDRLFQPFSQADASISRRFGGTGLGLVICKRLVEGLGGDIGVDSTPGQGSRFHFRLSFAPAQPPSRQADAPRLMLPPMTVLVAEDNLVNQQVARDLLENAGHRVSVAADGAEAVELAKHGGFDLILMDMQMPEVDGLEATRRIRALPAPAGGVPIIALTANALPDDAARCRAAGMNGHLAKPVERRALDAAMAEATGITLSADLLLVGADAGNLRQRLHGLGHRVFPAATATIAINLLAARSFDLVVGQSEDDIAALRHARPQGPAILAVTTLPQDCPSADDIVAITAPAAVLAATISRLCRHRRDHDPAELETLLGSERMERIWGLLLESLRQHAATLGQNPDPAQYAELTHRIKGSAANLGLHRLHGAAEAEDSPGARQELAAALDQAILDTEARMCTMPSTTASA